MGANDDADHAWLAPTKALVRLAAATGVPTLGICLGHQLSAVALGGRVDRNPRGQQIGVLDVGWTEAAAEDPLLGPLAGPVRAVQWNNDLVLDLPEGAVVLARTPHDEVQAVRYADTVWGVQWHPEAGERSAAAGPRTTGTRPPSAGSTWRSTSPTSPRARDELRTTWRRSPRASPPWPHRPRADGAVSGNRVSSATGRLVRLGFQDAERSAAALGRLGDVRRRPGAPRGRGRGPGPGGRLPRRPRGPGRRSRRHARGGRRRRGVGDAPALGARCELGPRRPPAPAPGALA